MPFWDWVLHALNKLSILWMVDLVVVAAVPEKYFEIPVLIGVVLMARILRFLCY